jgi:hypothetical protein
LSAPPEKRRKEEKTLKNEGKRGQITHAGSKNIGKIII